MRYVYEVCRRRKGESCCDSHYFSSRKAAERWAKALGKNWITEIAQWEVYSNNDV